MERMIEILKLIASPFAVQRGAFPPFVSVADEIGLLYDDEVKRLGVQGRPGDKDADIRSDLAAIDADLDALSGTKEYWTDDALRDDPRWEQLRRRAQLALERLGQSVEPPQISWTSYARG